MSLHPLQSDSRHDVAFITRLTVRVLHPPSSAAWTDVVGALALRRHKASWRSDDDGGGWRPCDHRRLDGLAAPFLPQYIRRVTHAGVVAERLNAAVLKTAGPARVS